MLQQCFVGAAMTRQCHLLQIEQSHDSAPVETSKAGAATDRDGAEDMDASSTEQVQAHQLVVVTLSPATPYQTLQPHVPAPILFLSHTPHLHRAPSLTPL